MVIRATMVNDKELEAAESEKRRPADYSFQLPRALTTREKKYLLSVERGDLTGVKRMLLAAGKQSVRFYCNSLFFIRLSSCVCFLLTPSYNYRKCVSTRGSTILL